MAAGDGRVPVFESVREGYRFMSASWRTVLPAAVLVAAVGGVAQGVIGAAGLQNSPMALLLVLTVDAFSLAYGAFLLRLALRQDSSGFFGLQLGADELRLFGAGAALLFLFLIIATVGVFVFALALALTLASGGAAPPQPGDAAAAEALVQQVLSGPSGFVFVAVIVFFVLLMLWTFARLVLIYPATITERRMVIFSTFAWTKGNALHIIAVVFLAALPLALATGFIAGLVGALAGGAFGDPDAAFTANPRTILPRALLQFVITLGQCLLMAPALMGAYAYLYKGLRPAESPRMGP